MTGRGSDRLGWVAATAASAMLWSVGSLLALTIGPAPGEGVADQAVLLDMAPATLPSISAISDFAPDAADAPPSLAQPEAAPEPPPEPPTRLPADPAPATPIAAPQSIALPATDAPAAIASDLPPPPPAKVAGLPPDPAPKPQTVAKSQPKADAKPAHTAAPVARPATAGAAPKARAAKAGGGKGAANPATYGTAVMKKIKSTRRQSAPAKGKVVVGFSIATDGGLTSVQVLASSGNTGLDRVAMDHIRRAQPFPAPPTGAQRNFSFEFVGKP